jgi:hypothetical protein
MPTFIYQGTGGAKSVKCPPGDYVATVERVEDKLGGVFDVHMSVMLAAGQLADVRDRQWLNKPNMAWKVGRMLKCLGYFNEAPEVGSESSFEYDDLVGLRGHIRVTHKTQPRDDGTEATYVNVEYLLDKGTLPKRQPAEEEDDGFNL